MRRSNTSAQIFAWLLRRHFLTDAVLSLLTLGVDEEVGEANSKFEMTWEGGCLCGKARELPSSAIACETPLTYLSATDLLKISNSTRASWLRTTSASGSRYSPAMESLRSAEYN